jgi:hypothetical protein
VSVAGSMTGVPVMPISGVRSPQPLTLLDTAVAPLGSRLTCHSGAMALVASASNAYTLSFSVATNTTLCTAPLMVRPGRKSGSA